MKSRYQLARRAVALFPQTSYSDPEAVRHARRKWFASVLYLRDREVSRYHMDHRVQRITNGPINTNRGEA